MINLAVIGLGYWGRRHVQSARASGRFTVTRAVDLDPEAARPYADANGIAVGADIEDVLADAAVDAVSLATPHSQHPDQVAMAGRAGKHVYTEKPFAFAKADAERAVRACQETGVVIGLGHDQRFYPTVVEIKRLLQAGELGAPLHIESNISHNAHQKAYQARAAEVAGAEDSGAGRDGYSAKRKPAPWRMDPREAPTGPMVHFGIHRIDAFIHLIGAIDWVFANPAARTMDPEVTDTIAVSLKFRCGATGFLGCSLATPLNSRLQVFGSAGWAEARGPEDAAEYAKIALKSLTVVRGESRETTVYDAVDSVAANFSSFADAIEGRAPFIISPAQMIHNAAVMEAIERSVASGAKVVVET